MIIALCGKSASGKDTVQAELFNRKDRDYEKLISSTTRPMRPGEVNGREYYFRSNEEFLSLMNEEKLIEHRAYDTLVDGVPDTWYYGLEKRELDDSKTYLTILDLDGLKGVIDYYGANNVTGIYLDVTDKLRTDRCKSRGDFNRKEWNRRLAADRADFSSDRLRSLDVVTIKVMERDTPSVLANKVEEIMGFLKCLQENCGHSFIGLDADNLDEPEL